MDMKKEFKSEKLQDLSMLIHTLSKISPMSEEKLCANGEAISLLVKYGAVNELKHLAERASHPASTRALGELEKMFNHFAKNKDTDSILWLGIHSKGMAAMGAVSSFKDSKDVKSLVSLGENADKEIATAAVSALEELNSTDGLEFLAENAQNPVNLLAQDALLRLSAPPIEELIKKIKDLCEEMNRDIDLKR